MNGHLTILDGQCCKLACDFTLGLMLADKHLRLQRCHMDKEHIKGAADNVVVKTKEVAWHATGNNKLETDGKVDQV